MRQPAARISSVVDTGAVSASASAWRAISSSVMAATRRQSKLERSRSLREYGFGRHDFHPHLALRKLMTHRTGASTLPRHV